MGEEMPNNVNMQQLLGGLYTEDIREYGKLQKKITNLKNRKIFLLRCKKEKLQPTFLRFKTGHISFQDVNLRLKFENIIMQRFKLTIINLLITDTVIYLNRLQRHILILENDIKSKVPINTFKKFKAVMNNNKERLFQKVKQKNISKINRLLSKTKKVNENENKSIWIENLTDVTLPTYATDILNLGPKFATEISQEKQLPITEIICNIETGINHLRKDQKGELRAKSCNIIKNFKNKLKNNKKNNLSLSKKIQKTKKFLKDNPQLKVLRADKTNKTVIMTSNDYDSKMMQLLNDKKTYKQIIRDPTNVYQKKNNEIIDKWEKKQYISTEMAKKLKIHNSLPPKIYGLPKLHKEGTPLRPIVSCVQSPYTYLSKFLKNIISNIINKNEYYIKDSFHFKEKIKKIKIPKEYVMVSLDVISLYTNVPISLASEIIRKKWEEIKKHTDIPLEEMIMAVEQTLNSTYFVYNNNIYKQIEGCAMGASISSVIAQLVMEDLETTVLSQVEFEIPFFYRYVDDCITAIPKNQIELVLNKFNQYHKKLQFTYEKEMNNKINFLDITLHHQDEKIRTEWYTKKTWSSRYLNYESNHPINQKKSVIIGLIDRAIGLSDPEFRTNAINKAKKALTLNKYPSNLIDKISKERIHKLYNSSKYQKPIDKNNKHYISIPFVNGLSQPINKLFKKYNTNICYKAYNLMSNHFSKLKAETPKNKRSNIVYEIPCNNCEGVYIGQTSQYLDNRIKGHKYDRANVTALCNHVKNKKHTFNFEQTKIIGTEKNVRKREIIESIEIQKNKNAINDKRDANNALKIYQSVL